MEWKYNLHTKVRNSRTGVNGSVWGHTATDNGKHPAYFIIKDDGSKTKWSEGNILPIEEERKDTNNHVQYKINDQHILVGDTYYKYLQKLMDHEHNNIFDCYIYWNGTTFELRQHSTIGVKSHDIPASFNDFKNIVALLQKGQNPSKNKKKKLKISDFKKGQKVKLKTMEQCKKIIVWHSENVPQGWGTDYASIRRKWNSVLTVVDVDEHENAIFIKAEHNDDRSDSISIKAVDCIVADNSEEEESWYPEWGVPEESTTTEKTIYYLDISTIYSSSTSATDKERKKRIKELTNLFKEMSEQEINKQENAFIKADSNTNYTFHSVSPTDGKNMYYSSNQQEFIEKIKQQSSEDEWLPEEEEAKQKEYIDKPIKDEIKQMLPAFPVLLEGPVGSGKTTIATEVADELGLELLGEVMTRQTTLSMLMGYKNVNGDYIPSKLRDAYENGKFYLLEELNGGDPNTLLCLNTIENGFLLFPDGKVEAHPNFRMMATMNNITNAKDFGGRSILDLSTRNRFHTIFVPANPTSRFSKETTKIAVEIDKHLKAAGVTNLTTNRDLMRYEHMSKDQEQLIAIKKCLIIDKIELSNEDIEDIISDSKDWE